jgi:carbon-monoxide dehydrogenase small subunit
VEIRFGPIRASIGGGGSFRNDDSNRSGAIEAQGDDKRGRSKARGHLSYVVEPLEDSRSTVNVAFRFKIEGMLAQFNRPELVVAFVDYLLGQFVKNCNARLSGGTVTEQGGINALRLGTAVVFSRIKSLLRR